MNNFFSKFLNQSCTCGEGVRGLKSSHGNLILSKWNPNEKMYVFCFHGGVCMDISILYIDTFAAIANSLYRCFSIEVRKKRETGKNTPKKRQKILFRLPTQRIFKFFITLKRYHYGGSNIDQVIDYSFTQNYTQSKDWEHSKICSRLRV